MTRSSETSDNRLESMRMEVNRIDSIGTAMREEARYGSPNLPRIANLMHEAQRALSRGQHHLAAVEELRSREIRSAARKAPQIIRRAEGDG